ncbi:MAG: AraC family transcriptional regulator [bacterium]|nr:AraC family transcriptional regulator [bacterium]
MKRKVDKIYSKELRKYKKELLNASKRIRTGLEYIEKNYTKRNLSLERIASYANMCYKSFSYLWGNTMKVSLPQFINDIRIAKSQELLLKTTLKSKYIAEKVGFEDTNFCRIFQKKEHTSPLEYRKKHKLPTLKSSKKKIN